MNGSVGLPAITPEQFPLMRASRPDPQPFDNAIMQIADGLQTGAIRNVVFQEAKERLGRIIDEAWKRHVAAPHFHGRANENHKDLQDLYWSFSVTNLHEVISASKKVERTKVQGPAVAAMRELLNEALPLAEAVASLKSKVIKGRAPNTTPAKPENPNKIVRTCPVCFRAIAVVGGRMAHHGYSRPGLGYQTASCPGIRFQPLEISSAGLEWLIEALRKSLTDDEQAYESRGLQPEFLMGRRDRAKPREKIGRDDPLWPDLFKRHVAQLLGRIAMNRQGIPPLEERLANWKPAAQA